MNELTLEEVLKIAKRVEKWEKLQDETHEIYHGSFSFYEKVSPSQTQRIGNITVLKTKESAVKEGMLDDSTLSVEYNGWVVGGLRGDGAARVYEIAKEMMSEKGYEVPPESQRDAIRDKVRGKLTHEKLPLARRLGR